MSAFILSIDQGTTSTRVCIVNKKGELVAQTSESYQQIYPKPGWVEHDPEVIWSSTQNMIAMALNKAKISGKDIAAIGITNQRETIVVWDRHTGKPVYNAIVWQCRRTQDVCDKIKKTSVAKKIQKRTGLVVDPYFSASKIQWILKNVPGAKVKAQSGDLLAGTIDSFLLWKLTGGEAHKTDVSNASRTMLMNLQKCEWDPEMMDLFKVPFVMLPEICASNEKFGVTKGLKSLPDGIVISALIGDQQSALFGQTGFNTGDVKCTFGTGSFILMNTGAKVVFSKSKLLTTVAWKLKGQKTVYALEGGAFICGAAVQWLRDGLQLFQRSSEVEQLANEVSDSGGVEFVPALTGLGAPHWRPEARGIITGLTRGCTKSHIARATLEAMALQNVEIMTAMQKDLGKKLQSIKVDGGAAANNLLMQMQADFAGARVQRPRLIETTAMGAAYLAGLGVDFWQDQNQIREVWSADHEFSPEWKAVERTARMSSWKLAVSKLL